MQTRSVRPVHELLAAASSRVPIAAADGKSGAAIERVEVGGYRYVVKHLSAGTDWIMRLTGDRSFRPWQVWHSPLWERVPACIDPAVVAMERAGDRLTIVMRDVGAWLVPEGDSVIPLAQHRQFLDHMAAFHATYWGWSDDLSLLPVASRFTWFSPDAIAAELERPSPPPPVTLAALGWPLLAERAPSLAGAVAALHADPSPLVAALARTPRTLLHGDWKLGNLGAIPFGRTILLDWAVPGSGPPLYDLAHYLSLNAARLPERKEAAGGAYREALETRGVATSGWWDEQLELCLLGNMMLLGWEKALGGGAELAWWEEQGGRGARRLGVRRSG